LAAVLLCVTLCVLLLSGCDILADLGLVPEDDPDGGQSEEPGWSGVPVEEELNNPSIKVKFGVDVDLTGKDAVYAAFHELSAFIKKRGLSDQPDVIKLGDWIDLEGGLSVAPYGEGDYTGELSAENTDINESVWSSEVYRGKTLRLIVVGINSFQSKNGYAYQGEPEPSDHVVFQFQNVPVIRRMNKTGTNDGGYALSEMRKYLVPVGDEGGNFLEGLKTAGVPDEVLWAPTRHVANGGYGTVTNTDAMNDLLWLPTEREMFGNSDSETYYSSAAYETTENQARLEYYDGDKRREKFFVFETGSVSVWAYWESSPYSGNSTLFCLVTNSGHPFPAPARDPGGVAPAFCVR
jgi:hypothetical protein